MRTIAWSCCVLALGSGASASAATAATGELAGNPQSSKIWGAQQLPILGPDGYVAAAASKSAADCTSQQRNVSLNALGAVTFRWTSDDVCGDNGPYSRNWGGWPRFPMSPIAVAANLIAIPGAMLGSNSVDLYSSSGTKLVSLVAPEVSGKQTDVRGAQVFPLSTGGYITVGSSRTFRSRPDGSLATDWGSDGSLEVGDSIGEGGSIAVFDSGRVSATTGLGVRNWDALGAEDPAFSSTSVADLGAQFEVTSIARLGTSSDLLVFGFNGPARPTMLETTLPRMLAYRVTPGGHVNRSFGDRAGALRMPVGMWNVYYRTASDGTPSVVVDPLGRATITIRMIIEGDESLVSVRLLPSGKRDRSFGGQLWNRGGAGTGVSIAPIQIGPTLGIPLPPLNRSSVNGKTLLLATRTEPAACAQDPVHSHNKFLDDQQYFNAVVFDFSYDLAFTKPLTLAFSTSATKSRRTWIGAGHLRAYGPKSDIGSATPGCDSASLGAGNDHFDAGRGHDMVEGGAGNDTVHGGSGNDELYAGLRFTQLEWVGEWTKPRAAFDSGSGRDKLYGDADNDYLSGEAGSMLLDGGSGNDVLEAVAADVIMRGGSGNDVLRGGGARAVLEGGPGSDKITGTFARERILGGPGNDMIIANDSAYLDNLPPGHHPLSDFVDCGAGRDIAYVVRGGTTLNCESIRYIG